MVNLEPPKNIHVMDPATYEQATKVIEVMRDVLMEKYGIEFKVYLANPNLIRLRLEDLEKLMIELLHFNHPMMRNYNNMKTKTRKKEFIMHKTVFSLVAFEHGYSKSAIGKFVDNDHSSIINLINCANDYIDTKDKEFNNILAQYKRKIKSYVSIISENFESGNNPKSVFDTVLSKEQDIL